VLLKKTRREVLSKILKRTTGRGWVVPTLHHRIRTTTFGGGCMLGPRGAAGGVGDRDAVLARADYGRGRCLFRNESARQARLPAASLLKQAKTARTPCRVLFLLPLGNLSLLLQNHIVAHVTSVALTLVTPIYTNSDKQYMLLTPVKTRKGLSLSLHWRRRRRVL